MIEMKRLLVLLLCTSVVFISCMDNQIGSALTSAEISMNDNPEASLEVLKSIDKNLLSTRKQKAKYALLYSMALDKNYIDLKNDSIIAPAVEYYSRHGDADTRFRTHYYHARIFENAGDYDNALLAVSKAEALDTAKVDADVLCMLYAMKGSIYDIAWRPHDAIESYELARRYALESHKFRHYAYYTLYCAMEYRQASDSILFEKCLSEAQDYQEYFTLTERHIYQSIMLNRMIDLEKDSNEVLGFVENYLIEYPQSEKINWKNIARAYQYLNMHEKALEVLKLYTDYNDVSLDPGYYAILSEILAELKDYDEALKAHEKYASINDAEDIKLHQSDLKLVEQRHFHEIQEISQKYKFLYLTIIFLSILFVSLFYIIKWYKAYSKNKSEYDSLIKEYDELRRLEAKLNDAYRYLSEQMDRRGESSKDLMTILGYRIKSLSAFLKRPIPDALSKIPSQIEDIKKNKNYIVDSVGLLYAINYPDFVSVLQNHGLTSSEIGFCCLYIMGLNMPEVGEIIGKVSSIYNINSTIRKKLNISTSETNLDKWLVKKFSELYPQN